MPEEISEAIALTEGEKIFEKYLQLHKITWKKDQLFGVKRPDYLVQTSNGEILCEVKDFAEGNLDKSVMKGVLSAMLPFLSAFTEDYAKRLKQELARLDNVEGSVAGAWNPFPRLQEMVAEAGKQLRPAKGKLPCIVVVYNPGYMPHDLDLILCHALEKNRLFTPKQNTTVSALAVLESMPNIIQSNDLSDETSPILRLYLNSYGVIPLSPKALLAESIKSKSNC